MEINPVTLERLVRGGYPRRVLITSKIDDVLQSEVTGKLRKFDTSSDAPIVVEIDSDGGDIERGFALVQNLSMLRSPTVGVVYGRCSSAAFLVLQACTRRYAVPESKFGFHNTSRLLKIVAGQSPEEVAGAALAILDEGNKYRDRSLAFLCKRLTHITRGELAELMNSVKVLSAYEALSYKMIDEILSFFD